MYVYMIYIYISIYMIYIYIYIHQSISRSGGKSNNEASSSAYGT